MMGEVIEVRPYKLMSWIFDILPKRDVILFYSGFGFTGNSFYLYQSMRRKGICDEYSCVWLLGSEHHFRNVVRRGIPAILIKDKFKMLRYISQARFFITSSGSPKWKASSHVVIDLWHGIPIKSLPRFEVSPNYFLVTSSFVKRLFYPLFDKKPHFLEFGQPRCDVLLTRSKKDTINDVLAKMVGDQINKYNAIFMYLPTFRDYDKNATRYILTHILENKDFNKFIYQNNILFIVKPHPLDESYFEKFESDNVMVLKNLDLVNMFLTLYDILPAVDVLVTDYSSVYFDYLLLNRPIVFYIPDLEKYRETRGFLLKPYEKWTPGDKARTVDELIWALKEAINNPKKWERERTWLRDVMFKYQDGKASERIIKYFWGSV